MDEQAFDRALLDINMPGFNDMEALDLFDTLLARHGDMEGKTDAMGIFDIGRALTKAQALRKVDLRAQSERQSGRVSEKAERPEPHPRKENARE